MARGVQFRFGRSRSRHEVGQQSRFVAGRAVHRRAVCRYRARWRAVHARAARSAFAGSARRDSQCRGRHRGDRHDRRIPSASRRNFRLGSERAGQRRARFPDPAGSRHRQYLGPGAVSRADLAFKDVGARTQAGCFITSPTGLRSPFSSRHPATPAAPWRRRSTGCPIHAWLCCTRKERSAMSRKRRWHRLATISYAVAVHGTFDDCQGLVKQAFADDDLRSHVWLTPANSINLGRLLPQVFYYFVLASRCAASRRPRRKWWCLSRAATSAT